MACVVSKHIFGGGIYSTTHSRQLKMVGTGERQLIEVEIAKAKGGQRLSNGQWHADIVPPFMPKKFTDRFHPGGNSACYMIQTAILMGCDPIYLLGFTFQSGTGYHFGLNNPATRRRSFYVTDRPMHWLRWCAREYPGRVLLWPGWQGPIYEVFDEARHEPESDAPQLARQRADEPKSDGWITESG